MAARIDSNCLMGKLRLFSRELFYVLTAAMLIFILLEAVRPGIVAAYINIGWLLIVWLLNAILSVIIRQRDE